MQTTEQSTRSLPGSWVDRIFDRMQGLYGSLWVERWRNGDMVQVAGRQMDAGLLNAKAVWSEELAGFASRPDCIKAALDACKSRSLPPTLPEFAQGCRDAMRRIGEGTQKLSHTLTTEELLQQRESAEKVAATVKSRPTEFDGLKWAAHPRSKIAVQAVFNEAKSGNKVLSKVFDDLVTAGVVTPEGKALKLYINGEWTKCK